MCGKPLRIEPDSLYKSWFLVMFHNSNLQRVAILPNTVCIQENVLVYQCYINHFNRFSTVIIVPKNLYKLVIKDLEEIILIRNSIWENSGKKSKITQLCDICHSKFPFFVVVPPKYQLRGLPCTTSSSLRCSISPLLQKI